MLGLRENAVISAGIRYAGMATIGRAMVGSLQSSIRAEPPTRRIDWMTLAQASMIQRETTRAPFRQGPVSIDAEQDRRHRSRSGGGTRRRSAVREERSRSRLDAERCRRALSRAPCRCVVGWRVRDPGRAHSPGGDPFASRYDHRWRRCTSGCPEQGPRSCSLRSREPGGGSLRVRSPGQSGSSPRWCVAIGRNRSSGYEREKDHAAPNMFDCGDACTGSPQHFGAEPNPCWLTRASGATHLHSSGPVMRTLPLGLRDAQLTSGAFVRLTRDA